MRRSQIERARIDLERQLARDTGLLQLHERDRLRFPGRPNEGDGHFIRGVETLDQDFLVAFEIGRIINQERSEFIETGILHRALSFHRDSGMQRLIVVLLARFAPGSCR